MSGFGGIYHMIMSLMDQWRHSCFIVEKKTWRLPVSGKSHNFFSSPPNCNSLTPKIPDGHNNNLFVTVGFSFDWRTHGVISSGYNYNCFILPSMKNKVFMLSLKMALQADQGILEEDCNRFC